MRRFLPQLGALLFQLSQRFQGALQIPNMASHLDLLQPEILRRARADAGAALLRPDLPGRGHHTVIELGMRSGVVFELHHDAFVQPSQLASHLFQVEASLPSMQAVSRSISLLNLLNIRCLGSLTGGEPLLVVD